MVFTTMSSPIWERHIEELKHLLQERKNEFTQECIERDLEFAKKHYLQRNTIRQLEILLIVFLLMICQRISIILK